MAAIDNDPKDLHLDAVLKRFPITGRYHLFSLFLVSLAYITNIMYCSNYIFVAADIKYSCKDRESDAKKFQDAAIDGRCYQYDNYMELSNYDNKTNPEKSYNFSKPIKCKEWKYEEPDSFISEFHIECQDWKMTLVGTVHSFGNMIGLLLVGPLSDRFGRKKAVIFTGVIGGIMGLARSFTHWYWMYIALEFLESAIGDICSPMFILNAELVAKENRLFYMIIGNVTSSFSGGILALLAWKVRYWRNLLIVLYTPALLFIFYACLLDESPRWLLSKEEKAKAIKIIEKAAAVSNVSLKEVNLNNLNSTQKSTESVNTFQLLIQTFKSRSLLKRFLICIYWWITCTFINYGMTINSVSLQGNKYINYALSCLIDIPVNLVLLYLLNKFTRKMCLIASFLLGGVLCVIQPLISGNAWVTIALFLAGKCMASASFIIIYIFTSELFPTYTRNTMHAFCSSIGRLGSMLAPQTPLLMRYWQSAPGLLFGTTSLIAGLLTILVPDTANVSLPDTVQQAEKLDDVEEDK